MAGKTNKTGFGLSGFKNILFGLLVFSLIFGLSGVVNAKEINTCTTLNIDGEAYFLTSDISNSTAYKCMEIIADNITLDCQGNRIDGIDDWESWGVYAKNRKNLIIKNCILTDWIYGISLSYSNSSKIINSKANSNRRGIYIALSSNNSLINITTNSNEYGIYLYYNSNNQLIKNTANSNFYEGIRLFASSNNIIRHNTANSNRVCGIYLVSSSNNTKLK